MKKLLALIFILSACGDPTRIKHEGKIVHKIVIDLDNIERYFEKICNNDPVCVEEGVKNFLSLISEQ
jgi:hypothetical protein